MALAARLELRQGQSLVVTPRLLQAIALLQLSNIELQAYVEGELERNPLLRREESVAEAGGGDEPAAKASASLDEPDPGPPDTARAGGEAPPRADAPDSARWTERGGSPLSETLERTLARPKSLVEHLEDQAGLAGFDPADRAVASALIGAVDESGYLRAETAELAERLGCGQARIERVLKRLQGFEPAGLFARDVRECLMLQLMDRDRCDPAMVALLDNLHLLARRDLAALKRACGVDEADLRDMIAELRALKPRPGAQFGAEPIAPVIPDVLVRAGGDGLWRVDLNADTLPRLLIDHRYHAVVSASARTDEEKAFISDCLAEASWLTRSLDQRARTLLKVAAEIVRRQDEFLAFGVERLRPLTLKAVAEAVGVHESTVSRATAGKYLSTPRGMFEMKFFFTAALPASEGGEGHSPESVRRKIKRLIETEPRDGDALSDDRLVDLLKESGVDIARRTVAKYREALRIPSSMERRRRLRDAV
jgi:RNA polymerase sigma-54 factor